MDASFNNGHEAITTPAVPRRRAIKISAFSFSFKKNIDEKLMSKGPVATDSAPIPAVTFCMAIT